MFITYALGMIMIFVLTSNEAIGSLIKSKETPTPKLRFVDMNRKCEPNQDNRYNRVEMLEKLGTILDETMISYYNAKYRIKKKSAKNPKFVIDERPNGFFVFDLTDTSNTGKPLGECIEFKDNHIYHFSLIHLPYSFSHIAVLEGGTLRAFKAINCKDGDSMEDVIRYINQKLKDDKDKDQILDRVRDFRKYGIYNTIDDDSLRCQEIKGSKH